MKLIVGNKYAWNCANEKLIYIGKKGGWNQFALIEEPDRVWCEVLDSDLHLMGELK